ncbi:MAG TPA: ATP-binding protein [Steroidobacteraceae bacterium]|nr:ATP-binding protein [Steroidobacteraceae bacterium]
MALAEAARPLHLHTIESLCADLVSGRAVLAGAANEPIRLEEPAARAILDWYRTHRRKWASAVRVEDTEAIVDAAIAGTPPTLPAVTGGAAAEARRFRLIGIRAHRFAGLHGYSTALARPEDLRLEPAPDLTLIEGANGSGKTSIVNAILWCLTGMIGRPQRPPESGSEEFRCRIGPPDHDSTSDSAELLVTPVTPLPLGREDAPGSGEGVLIDTWVELTLTDDEGKTLTVRRAQSRTLRGKITEQVTNLEQLALDPLALRIGTLMPALLPHIRLADPSELGRAVSELTGLAELGELARHAARVRTRLEKDLAKEQESRIARLEEEFARLAEDLYGRLEEYPAMAPPTEPPRTAGDPHTPERLRALTDHLEHCKAHALESARAALGENFDPYDIDARLDLEASIGPARGELAASSRLPSAARLQGLGSLSEAELLETEAKLDEIRGEADLLAALAASPALARRKRLYARIAAWLREAGAAAPDACPVCGGSLDSATDPLTQRSVHEHLSEAMSADAELIGQSVGAWSRAVLGTLARELPRPLKAELDLDLPAEPRELARAALAKELFEAPCFARSLAPLARLAQTLCERHLPSLAGLGRVIHRPFPPALDEAAWSLERACRRIERAIAFARWRGAHDGALRALVKAVVGPSGDPAAPALAERLTALAGTLAGSAPIDAALALGARMAQTLAERTTAIERLSAYARTAEALAAVIALGELAERQVESLRQQLRARAAYWRDALYRGGHGSALELTHVRIDARGALELSLGCGATSAPAHQIANASQLRASLLGFLIAFFEHVLAVRGGLRLVSLDDPQEMLDRENRERLAGALARLAAEGAQLLVTTHDRDFAASVMARVREPRVLGVKHLRIAPPAAGEARIALELASG